jgi:hypothetical protein
MIAVIIAGLVFLVLVAIVVGIVDTTQRPRWRRIAAERRERWEARQPQLHGVDPHAEHESESWDDD